MEMTVTGMRPEDVMRKRAFGRPIPQGGDGRRPLGRADAEYRRGEPVQCELLTQDDFLREYHVNSHRINTMKYYPGGPAGMKQRMKVQTRVAIGFQERIHTKRLTALIGNNVDMRLIREVNGRNMDMLALLREGWEDRCMEVALHDALSADGMTGDCAVCFHLYGGEAGWRVLSYANGDTLWPHYDPMTGDLALFGRSYHMDAGGGTGAEFLDVWDGTRYMRWRRGGGDGGWVVDAAPTPHGFPSVPVAYHRYGDTFWAPSQALIDGYELALSQFCENNSAYALRILYTLGQSMEVHSSLDGTPSRIDSADTGAKVGFLEPADASESFRVQLETMERNIMRSSFAVETPDIKSGADMSSLTVKMLFADTYLKALEDSQRLRPFLSRCLSLFKFAYGVETGRVSDLTRLRVKAEFEPFIFMSESETVNAIVQLVASGAMSRRTATEIAYKSGYGSADEWQRIISEAHDEYAGTAAQDLDAVSRARADAE